MLLRSHSAYYKRSKMINFFAFSEVPIKLIMVLFTLYVVGLTCLYSANGGAFSSWVSRQCIFMLVSIPVFLFTISVNINIIRKASYIFLMLVILLLLYVLLFGKRGMGAVRWIDFGFFTLQPSELAKIGVVLGLARYFNNAISHTLSRWYVIIPPLLLVFPIITLVMIQPDLATSIVIIGTVAAILFLIGISIWYFICAGVLTLLSAPIIWLKLKEYQKLRIINFLNPDNDPLGSGYNILQSKIAIGSGGLLGKGFLNGTQGRLHFLPEHHTDFIFTIIGEEFGFIGCLFVLSLYLYIVLYGAVVAINAKTIFAKIVSSGCSLIIFIHVFINIGMTLALMPAAGIPLPFISYGGTTLMTSIICVGLIVNVDINSRD